MKPSMHKAGIKRPHPCTQRCDSQGCPRFTHVPFSYHQGWLAIHSNSKSHTYQILSPFRPIVLVTSLPSNSSTSGKPLSRKVALHSLQPTHLRWLVCLSTCASTLWL
jgi:hypothetical protein